MGQLKWGGKTFYPQAPKPFKSDVNELRKGQVEIHKEMTGNTRLLLVAMFGTATLFFGANRYLDDRNQVTPKLS